MRFLIDTDILIYSIKGNEAVHAWMSAHLHLPKFISVITYGELIYGARKSTFSAKNLATAHRIAELFPVVQIDTGIIEVFGELKADLEKKGTPIDDMDLLIASTALYHNYALVTNNTRHFSKVNDLVLEKWYE